MDELTRDIVLKFFEAKNADHPCDACGHDGWGLAEKESQFSADLMCSADGGSPVFPTHYIPLVIIFCQNCGQVRSFAKGMIENWARQEGLLPKEERDGS